MVKFQMRTSLALLLLGFALGFCTATFFSGCNKAPSSKKETVVKPNELNKQAGNLERNYQDQIAKLQDENLELQQNLEVTEGLLQQAKQAVREREAKIKRLALFDGYHATGLLVKFNPAPPLKIDTSPCDSLVNEVADYIEANHRKDSLYEQQLFQMDSVVSVKDKLIQTSDLAYKNLNQLFDQSVISQKTLLKENLAFKKQFRRQKLKGKLLTIGGIVLTGLTANYLLNH